MKSWFSQTELLHFFNDLLFDSFKLQANPVRFHRQPPSPIALPRQPQATPRASIPVRQRDNRSYVEVVRAIQPTLPNSPTVEITTLMSSECKTSPLPIVQHIAVEEDIAWLKTSLFERISDIGVNYKSIKRGLIDSDMQLIGFCFMRGTQALISFDSAEDMMVALQVDTRAWKNNFDELSVGGRNH